MQADIECVVLGASSVETLHASTHETPVPQHRRPATQPAHKNPAPSLDMRKDEATEAPRRSRTAPNRYFPDLGHDLLYTPPPSATVAASDRTDNSNDHQKKYVRKGYMNTYSARERQLLATAASHIKAGTESRTAASRRLAEQLKRTETAVQMQLYNLLRAQDHTHRSELAPQEQRRRGRPNGVAQPKSKERAAEADQQHDDEDGAMDEFSQAETSGREDAGGGGAVVGGARK
jgi:hypothetical protein